MLTTHFIRRGYPKHLVLGALERTDGLKRDNLLKPLRTTLTQRVPRNVTASPSITPKTLHSGKLSHLIGKSWLKLKQRDQFWILKLFSAYAGIRIFRTTWSERPPALWQRAKHQNWWMKYPARDPPLASTALN